MMRTLIKTRAILTMNARETVVPDGVLLVNGGVIERLMTAEEATSLHDTDVTVVDAREMVALPGFVHTHVHLCQTLFRGLAEDVELLDWLQLRIFPFEAAHSSASMYASARIGLAELIQSGTTTIMDMGSIHHEEEVVRAVTESGIRAFLGKAMMDINELHPPLCESTKDALASTLHQVELWHGSASGRIRYAVAPRFILSCSDPLLKEAHAMTRAFPGMLFHTHASENRHELEAVRKRCGMDNVEYFDALGILNNVTCLAHCIWLNDREVDLMAERQSRVLHCPSSNMKLGSGIASIPRYLSRGIPVSLGADGAPCNNTLNMFQEMRLAALIQKPAHGPTAMPARTVLRLATMGGADALGLGKEIGSLEPGKRADILLLDLSRSWNTSPALSMDSLAVSIVHACGSESVRAVMANGEWIFRDGTHTTINVERAVQDARAELHALLNRAEIR
jgi:cytosine/adenosine deaminase-related metal-dependent hydrolase